MQTNVTARTRSGQRLKSATQARNFIFLLAFLFAFSLPARSTYSTHDESTFSHLENFNNNNLCIRSASSVVGVDYAASGTVGHFNATIDIKVQNAGTTPLFNLALLDDFSAVSQYGTAFINLVSDPEIIESTATTNPTINALYNGTTTNQNMLNGDGLLNVGESFTIRLTIELHPAAANAPSVLQHQATTIADGIENNQTVNVLDLSDSGNDPLTTNPDQPGDTGGENDPTLLSDCSDLLTQGFACNDGVNMAVDGFCNISLDIDAILENHFAVCDGGDAFPLGGFYRMEVWFENGDMIPDIDSTTTNIYEIEGQVMDRPLVVRVSDIIYGNSCSGNLIMEDKIGPVCDLGFDVDTLINYDWDNDGIIEMNVTDPSGVDDLMNEYILCSVIQQNGHDIYFDELEAHNIDGNNDGDFTDVGIDALADFSDCTAINYITFEDTYTEVCDLEDLQGIPVDESRFNPNEFSIAEIYKRTWSAIDIHGQVTSDRCEQYVFGLRPKAHRVILEEEISIDCTEDIEIYAPFYTVDNHIENNGLGSMGSSFLFPNGDDEPSVPASEFVYFLNPSGHSCMYSIGFHEDEAAEICDGTSHIVRHWSVIDWCNGNRIYDEFSQLIKVEDKTAPFIGIDLDGDTIVDVDEDGEFILPPTSFELEANPFNCNGSGNIPFLVTSDNCSGAVDDVYNVSIEGIPDFPNHPNEPSIFIAHFENGGNISNLDLPMGDYSIKYFAEDDCGNGTSFTTTLNIVDRQAPVAICNDALNVTLTNFGDGFGARIYGEDLDDSSYDNCQNLNFLVLSTNNDNTEDDTWNPWVEFSCADVNEEITVQLLVFEDVNNDGRFFDEETLSGDPFSDGIDDFDGGKSTSCWTSIRVEDKDRPRIICEDRTLDCNDPNLNVLFSNIPTEDLDNDGIVDANGFLFAPEFAGGCPNSGNIDLSLEIVNIDYEATCKKGSFIRRFTATRLIEDEILTDVCEQVITVDFVSDWTMTFPADVVMNCDTMGNRIPAPLSINEILDSPTGCDAWGMEVFDETFDISGQDGNGSCYKVVRTYKFVNWCTWDITNTELGIVNRPVGFVDEGEEVQLRHRSFNFGLNEFGDEDDEDDYNESLFFKDDGALVTLEFLDNPQSADAFLFGRLYFETINESLAVGVYAENYGYFAYRQVIKVIDTQAPIVEEIADVTIIDTTSNCAADFLLFPPEVEECRLTYEVEYELTDADNNIFSAGTFPGPTFTNNVIAIEDAPLGEYVVTYLVSDACGNVKRIEYNLSIVDGKAPTAYCLYNLAVDLMPSGMIEIEAARFDRGSFDSCTDGPLTFSFSPDTADTTKIMTCDSTGTRPQNIYVTDALGNQAFCSNFVTIQAHGEQELCGAGRRIAGYVQTPEGQDVESVAVYLSGGMDDMSMTSVDGAFSFSSLENGHDYSLVPEKDVNPLNGVSTLDMVLIKKHILGLQLLNTPYKLIAADINRSNTLTTFDLVELRKLILNIETDFTNNTSWRFIPSDYVFPEPSNPWAEEFPELLNVNDLEEDQMAIDFIAIKIGDMNANAIPNNLVDVDDRNNRSDYIIELEDISLKQGNIYTLDFHTTDAFYTAFRETPKSLAGYQMTLNFNTDFIIFEEVEDALTQSDNFGLHLIEKGLITLSWNGDTQDTDLPLFSFSIKAKQDGQLSDYISISSDVTTAEAYTTLADGTLNTEDVVLKFNDTKSTKAYLYQNQPNPFDNMTKIAFDIPQADVITLSWYNLRGDLVHSLTEKYTAGHHEVWVDAKDLPTGLLYYSLKTKAEVLTKKMMVVR